MSKYNKHVSLILALLSAVGSLSFNSVNARPEIYQSPSYLSLKKDVQNGKKTSIFKKIKFWEKGNPVGSVAAQALEYYENEKVQNILKKAFELKEYADNSLARDVLSTKTLALCIICAERLQKNLKEENLTSEEIDLLKTNAPFHVIQGIARIVESAGSSSDLSSEIAKEFIHQEKSDIETDVLVKNKMITINKLAGTLPQESTKRKELPELYLGNKTNMCPSDNRVVTSEDPVDNSKPALAVVAAGTLLCTTTPVVVKVLMKRNEKAR